MHIKIYYFQLLFFFTSIALASCGGGGSNSSTVSANNDLDMPTTDTPVADTPIGNDDTTQNPAPIASTPIASNCPVIGVNFGGDVVGNEYMESGQRNALLFGEAIGFNTLSGADVTKSLPLSSCIAIEGLEFGQAYSLVDSARINATDISIEVRNTSARFLCEITAVIETLDSQGVNLRESFETIGTNLIPISYDAELNGRSGTVSDDASGTSDITKSASCLRPGEISYLVATVGIDRFIGFNGFDEIAGVNLTQVEVSDFDWVENAPILPQFSGYTLVETTSSHDIDFTFDEELDFNTISEAIMESRDGLNIRFVVLNSLGRPVFHSGANQERIFNFQGSANSVRVQQF